MSKREILAYAITHAPRGQKGGPYEGPCGIGRPVPTLAEAWRKRTRATVRRWLRAVRAVVPHARAIRIVRARPTQQPSEASAVEVLRELVAVLDRWNADTLPMSRMLAACTRIEPKARAVLAASGPDPAAVVRAAMAWSEATAANGTARTVALQLACVAYRKAGGK